MCVCTHVVLIIIDHNYIQTDAMQNEIEGGDGRIQELKQRCVYSIIRMLSYALLVCQVVGSSE